MRRRNIARDVAGLVLAGLGALALIALGTLLASRHEWLAVGLLAVGLAVLGIGVWLGRYDPAAARGRQAPPELGDDAIEMRPRKRMAP